MDAIDRMSIQKKTQHFCKDQEAITAYDYENQMRILLVHFVFCSYIVQFVPVFRNQTEMFKCIIDTMKTKQTS